MNLETVKSLPHSSECERAVLGSVLIDASILDELHLHSEDFYEERNQILYRAFQQLRSENRDIDPRTVQALLEGWALLDRVGGPSYISGLDVDLPDWGRAPQYAAVVKERANRRGAIQVAGEIIRGACDGETEIKHLLGQAATSLDCLVEERAGGDFVRMREAVGELGEWIDREHLDEVSGAMTGIGAIDQRIVAMEPGQFWLVAARPGVGKTALMLQAVEHAILHGRKVGIVSLEMRRIELLMRLNAKRSGAPFSKLRKGVLTRSESARFTYAQQEMQHWPLWIDDTSGRTVEEIIAKVRTLRRKEGIEEVWIDYLTLIDHAGGNRQDLVIDRMANRLAGLAKDQEIPVIALAQLGKKSDQERRAPILADLKDAGEAPAYGVLIANRDVYDHNRSLLKPEGTITVAKNRGGELGETLTTFDGPTMTWRERDLNHAERS